MLNAGKIRLMTDLAMPLYREDQERNDLLKEYPDTHILLRARHEWHPMPQPRLLKEDVCYS